MKLEEFIEEGLARIFLPRDSFGFFKPKPAAGVPTAAPAAAAGAGGASGPAPRHA